MVKVKLLAASLLLVSGCANYQFGDISKVYCGSVNQEFRAQIKATLKDKGYEVGINYCAAHGLVDALRNG